MVRNNIPSCWRRWGVELGTFGWRRFETSRSNKGSPGPAHKVSDRRVFSFVSTSRFAGLLSIIPLWHQKRSLFLNNKIKISCACLTVHFDWLWRLIMLMQRLRNRCSGGCVSETRIDIASQVRNQSPFVRGDLPLSQSDTWSFIDCPKRSFLWDRISKIWRDGSCSNGLQYHDQKLKQKFDQKVSKTK